MKKLSLYIFLVLMVCNVGFAECMKGNCISGQGTFTYANEDKYVGEVKDGIMHGQGTFTTTDGRVIKGIWENNKLIERQE